MEDSGLQKLTVAQRASVYNMLADLLVAHAQRISRHAGAPLTGKFVANCAGSIAAVFDAAYPGYVRAGLAPLVAQRLTERRTEE